MEDKSKPNDNLAGVFLKFLKFCFFAVVSVYLAATVLVIRVLHHPAWHAHLLNLFHRVWVAFVAEQVGSTSPGFVNSITATVVGLVLATVGILYFQGLAAMRRHVIETVAMGVVCLATVVLLVYGTQFAWEVAKADEKDHQD